MSSHNPDIADHGVIRLGRYVDNSVAYYDLQSATNFNAAIVGQSGTGKTYALKRLVRAYRDMGVTVVLLDVHGDFETIEGVAVNQICSTRFAYSDGDGGINPLHVQVGATGGLYIAIKQFISVAKMFNPSLGSQQASTLRRLVQKLYSEFGFVRDDPTTWGRAAPTISDLVHLCSMVLAGEFTGVSPDFLKQIGESHESIAKGDCSDDAALQFGEDVTRLLSEMRDGELEVWESKKVESAQEIVIAMRDSGLFGKDSLRLKSNMINRIVLTGLHETDQAATIHLVLDRLFNLAYREFRGDNPSMPRLIIVLDEGKIAKRISKSEMSPINRIATEIRKFGGGLVLGVQSSDHLTDDVRRNCGMISLLPVHPTDYMNAQRMFQVTADQIKALRPRQDGLLYVKNNQMRQVKLFAP